ncbi:MAG: hypothetical protein HKN17_08110 [Rhodothermales bacterium]|nr:hypothetical protein [Rhodothermales bacterium]
MNSRFVAYITVLTIVLFGAPSSGFAQDRASSDSLYWSGDSLVTRTVNGRSQSMLLGARLTQGATSIRADTGVDEGDGIYTFRGNVRIVEKADTIDAPFVRYDRNTKIGRASGGVRLTDGSVVVRSPAAVHYSREERTAFENGVAYEDSSASLTARTAVYFSNEERVDFRGGVRLKQDSTRVFADSLRYFRESEESTAAGRVAVVTDESDRVTVLFADRLERYASNDSTVAVGRAALRTVTSNSADTLFVSAGSLVLTSSDVDRLTARDSVVVVSGRFSARSDSLVHRRTDSLSTSRFIGSPVAWVRRTQIRADTIRTIGDGGSIRRIGGGGGVFVAAFDSLTGRIQQMSGRTLTARLRSDTLRSIVVGPNARGIFFQERASANEDAAGDSVSAEPAVGATVASADSLRLYFSGGDVDSLAFVGVVEGSWYSPNLISRVSDLDGYSWTPELEPDIRHIRTLFRETMSRRVTQRAAPSLDVGRSPPADTTSTSNRIHGDR